ncbi:MAG: GNAT family N-acetyltransferase, partial [Oscillospiraceae bacterium]|nr:GNAT family N-acetyltransferase [Oscillospiraceae bacterium]
AGSLAVLGAYDGERLIGLVRAVGDGASVLLVQDLLVRPDCQRRSVGTALLRTLLARFGTVYQIFLMTDDTPEHDAFYCSLGLTRAEGLGACTFTKMA